MWGLYIDYIRKALGYMHDMWQAFSFRYFGSHIIDYSELYVIYVLI